MQSMLCRQQSSYSLNIDAELADAVQVATMAAELTTLVMGAGTLARTTTNVSPQP